MDKRIVERNIAKGLVTKDEYEQHLASLADCEGDYERVEIDPGDASEDLKPE